MKKTIAIAAAIGLASTAAYADNHRQMDDDGNLIEIPSSNQTETYDGPNTTTAPGQPAPTDTDAKTNAVFSTYTPAARTEYPFCSETMRDNCRQRRDPSYGE